MGFQRQTKQREAILEELREATSHPTAVELYEMVRKRLPKISLGTVYRNLERLAEDGSIKKLESGNAQARFDGRREHHWHVRCVRCAGLSDLMEAPVVPESVSSRDLDGHVILGLRVEYVGVCPTCKEQMPGDELARLRSEWE